MHVQEIQSETQQWKKVEGREARTHQSLCHLRPCWYGWAGQPGTHCPLETVSGAQRGEPTRPKLHSEATVT